MIRTEKKLLSHKNDGTNKVRILLLFLPFDVVSFEEKIG
jgi:hypothetical protein